MLEICSRFFRKVNRNLYPGFLGFGTVAVTVIFNAHTSLFQVAVLWGMAVAVGTFILVFMILALTDGCNVGWLDDNLAPVFVGVTLAVIISIIAPLT